MDGRRRLKVRPIILMIIGIVLFFSGCRQDEIKATSVPTMPASVNLTPTPGPSSNPPPTSIIPTKSPTRPSESEGEIIPVTPEVAPTPSQSPLPGVANLPENYELKAQSINDIDLRAIDPTIIKSQFYDGTAGGGGGGPVGSGCLTGHDHRLIPYSEPTITTQLLSRGFKGWEYGSLDICVCGLEQAEEITVNLISPTNKNILEYDVVAAQAQTSVGLPIVGSYCAEGTGEIDAFSFIPGDEVGQYQVQVATQNGFLSQTLELQPIVEPIVYFSSRVGGYVLAGFEPFEAVSVLVYELVRLDETRIHQFIDFNLQIEVFFELDAYGLGLLEGITSNQAIAVIRGDPTEDYFEIVPGFDYGINFIDWEILTEQYPQNANIYYHQGDYSTAIEIDPTYYLAYFKRGSEEMARLDQSITPGEIADYEMVLSDFDRAIELAEDFYLAYEARFEVLMRLGRYQDALADATKMIESNPNSPEGYFARGYAYYKTGDDELALADYTKVIELDPFYSKLHFWSEAVPLDFSTLTQVQIARIELLYESGDLELVNEDIQRAVALYGYHPIEGMDGILIPAGTFLMGSQPGDPGTETIDQPQRPVYLDSFLIDQHEVTNGQYRYCVDVGVCRPPTQTDSATRTDYYDGYPNYPVVHVSWQNAVDYCTFFGRRLPTEAEWERAARGVDGRLYSWGNQPPEPFFANYNSQDTLEVGYLDAILGAGPNFLNPNGWIYDIIGNVWEWTADYYADDYYTYAPEANPIGPESGDERVIRGGSWTTTNPAFLRAANRWSRPENFTDGSIGFRCAASDN